MFERAREDTVPDESMLETGELRRSFVEARGQAARTPRWMSDLMAGPRPVPVEPAELREREERIEAREQEVDRREQAVARWFRDLSRAQRRIERERGALGSGHRRA